MSVPIIGPYWDSAFVLSEFQSATGNDSYVQRAFSWTQLGMIGSKFTPSTKSVQLWNEAKTYAKFSLQIAAKLGYENTVEDLTDRDKLKVRYMSDNNVMFVIGPFKIDYLKCP